MKLNKDGSFDKRYKGAGQSAAKGEHYELE